MLNKKWIPWSFTLKKKVIPFPRWQVGHCSTYYWNNHGKEMYCTLQYYIFCFVQKAVKITKCITGCKTIFGGGGDRNTEKAAETQIFWQVVTETETETQSMETGTEIKVETETTKTTETGTAKDTDIDRDKHKRNVNSETKLSGSIKKSLWVEKYQTRDKSINYPRNVDSENNPVLFYI